MTSHILTYLAESNPDKLASLVSASLSLSDISLISNFITKHRPELGARLYPNMQKEEQTSISVSGDFNASYLTKKLWDAFLKALALKHQLPDSIVWMDGMSGKKYRYFINNLLRLLEDEGPTYLEIGCAGGSTACAALHENKKSKFVFVDNWKIDESVYEVFLNNTSAARKCSDVKIIKQDFRMVDWHLEKLGAKVYFYDGPHEEADQYDALRLVLPALAEEFVFICDDFNWASVRKATERAIELQELKVSFSITIKTTTDDMHSLIQRENSDWYNGYFIAVINKAYGP
jgi:hypothetical protein